MTGKEFFGKLLSNRQERGPSWNEEESQQGVPDADVDVMPSDSGGPREHHSHDGEHHSQDGEHHSHDDTHRREDTRSHDVQHSDGGRPHPPEPADARPNSYFDTPLSHLEAHPHERENRDASGFDNGGYPESRFADAGGSSDAEPTAPTISDRHSDEAYDRSAGSHRDEHPYVDSPSFNAPGGDGLSADVPDVQPAPIRPVSDQHNTYDDGRHDGDIRDTRDDAPRNSAAPHSAPSGAEENRNPEHLQEQDPHAGRELDRRPDQERDPHAGRTQHASLDDRREAHNGNEAPARPGGPEWSPVDSHRNDVDAAAGRQADHVRPAESRHTDPAPDHGIDSRSDAAEHAPHSDAPQFAPGHAESAANQAPSQPDHAPSAPDHAPSVPDHAPSVPDYAQRAPEQAHSRPEHTPSAPEAVQPERESALDAPGSAQPASEPAQPALEPAQHASESAQHAPESAHPALESAHPAPEPVHPAPEPVQHPPEPVQHPPEPVQPAPEPVQHPPAPESRPAREAETQAERPPAERGPEPADRAPHQPDAAQESGAAPEAPTGAEAAGTDGEEPAAGKEKPASKKEVELGNIKDRVVQRLLDKEVVTAEQVKAAITNRDKKNLKATLWRILAQKSGTDREQIYREAALTYAFTERKIDEAKIELDFIRQVADVFPEKKRNRLIELRIVPIGYEFEQQTQMLRVVFITHDPSLPAVRELMQDLNLERYELQYASETTVKDLLSRAFPKKNEYLERMSDDPLAYDLGTSYDEGKSELIDEDALEAEINRSSLINLFEGALVEAVHRGASDIHIYPNAHRQIEFHFRVDGRLAHWHTEDKVHPESLLAVIKDNTMNVDRFERDMAQDGFIQRKVDDALIRYRVSILPIATAQNGIHAESIVIRVLDDRKVITDLSQLGLLEGALERFDMAIRQPHGMVILTGPTGSGKSTTLVAALHQVVTPEVNVLTVEDPVEYIIPGVRQIKLNHKLGLEGALRAILRHDPDVVMVGEMRDKETADLAVKLANTGHLTFSTLHTNDAPSAVSRLYKMGVEPFLIAYAINLVVAQRLLRNLCPDCKVVDNDPDPVLLKKLGFTDQDLHEHTIYKASGDPTCKTCKGVNYKGRRAISEALYFSREVRHMIVEADQKIDEDALRETARKQGMLTLQDSAREVVKMGETSVDEMMRVTMTED